MKHCPERLENPSTTEKFKEIELRELFSNFKSDDPNSETALREAAVRAAMNDSPWSAAFISYLMDQVNMGDEQFR